MKTHFNTENIDYIKFYPRHKSDYVWQPIAPRTTLFFGLLTNEPEVHAGWGRYERSWRFTPEELVVRNLIYVYPEGDELFETYDPAGSWDNKPCVYVRTKETDHTRYFDTDAEAEEWIRELEVMSKAEFAVIIKD